MTVKARPRKRSTADIFRNAFYPLTLPLTVAPVRFPSPSLSEQMRLTTSARISFAILAAVISSALLTLSIYLCYGFADRLAAIIAKAG